jgi:rhodanese-related sulfurtransferase
MPQAVDLEQLRRLVDDGAQLIEVLPAVEYEEERLPGAVNLPLKELDATSAERLDRSRAVIVYCYDSL